MTSLSDVEHLRQQAFAAKGAGQMPLAMSIVSHLIGVSENQAEALDVRQAAKRAVGDLVVGGYTPR